jgi:aminomethyltransferase
MAKKTPLYENHLRLGARMTEFAGWLLPLQYDSIINEHNRAREKVVLFDTCHLGEIQISGPGAFSFLQWLTTNDLQKLETGQSQYTLLCNEEGGILDDLLIYRLAESTFWLVVNSACLESDLEWIKSKIRDEVMIEDISLKTGKIDLQGPLAPAMAHDLLGKEVAQLKRNSFTQVKVENVGVLASATGYTGEAGYELYLPWDKTEWFWDYLLEKEKPFQLRPAGLGARDSLRLEKGFLLYGQDADVDRTPIEAGLDKFISWNKGDFSGRNSLQEKQKPKELLVWFEVCGEGVARHGYNLEKNGERVGIVTSGGYCPSIGKSIGMGYVKRECARKGEVLNLIIRGREVPVMIRRNKDDTT